MAPKCGSRCLGALWPTLRVLSKGFARRTIQLRKEATSWPVTLAGTDAPLPGLLELSPKASSWERPPHGPAPTAPSMGTSLLCIPSPWCPWPHLNSHLSGRVRTMSAAQLWAESARQLILNRYWRRHAESSVALQRRPRLPAPSFPLLSCMCNGSVGKRCPSCVVLGQRVSVHSLESSLFLGLSVYHLMDCWPF